MGGRINTIMQTCFFAISGVLPRDEAIAPDQEGHREDATASAAPRWCRRNFAAVDATLAHLHEVPVPAAATATRGRPPLVPDAAPDFVQRVTAALMLAGKGDRLPVSALPGRRHLAGRHGEVGEAQHRARDPGVGLRASASSATSARWSARTPPSAPRSTTRRGSPARRRRSSRRPTRGASSRGARVHDSGRARGLHRLRPLRARLPGEGPDEPAAQGDRHAAAGAAARRRARELRLLPRPARDRRATILPKIDHKTSQFLEPLFEYSGACAGCGETPYLKLLTQLFGDRLLIANATGCSSIYGGNLPTTPYTTNRDGRGPAWSNSLFEDNAEFGLGMRLGVDSHVRAAARARCASSRAAIGERLAADAARRRPDERGRHRRAARARRARCARRSAAVERAEARAARQLADYLVHKSVWLVGGDGWAYDIGYGGLDHVLASQPRRQRARARHRGLLEHRRPAVEGDAARRGGEVRRRPARPCAKKDLGLIADTYGHVYVARVAFGAKMTRRRCRRSSRPRRIRARRSSSPTATASPTATTWRTARRSRSWPSSRASGRSIRFDPRRVEAGEPPLHLDYGPPTGPRRRLHAQRVALPHGRAHEPRALQGVPPGGAGRRPQQRYAVYQQLAGVDRAAPTSTPGRTAGRARSSHGSDDDVSRLHAAPPARAGRLAAGRRPRHGAAASRTPARPAIVLRSLFEEQISREQMAEHVQPRRPRRVVRRGRELLSRCRAPSRSAPTQYLEQLRRVKEAVAHAGDRVAERHDARRLARVRGAHRAGRRRRARAERLPRAPPIPTVSGADVERADDRDRRAR